MLVRTLKILALAFCPLLLALCFLSLSACKKPTEPPAIAKPDTTSHNFVWQIDTLGDGNSSVLNDVCIIDENNVWAVGEIYVKDATGQFNDPPYNAARWDGRRWNFLRVLFPICGTADSYPFAARAIFTVGPRDIWISSAGTIARWNGSSFSTMCIPASELSGSINKLWGGV